MPIIRSEIQKRLSQTLTIHSHYQVNFPKLAPFALSCPNVCSLFATEMRQKVLMCLKLPCTFYPFLQLMMSFYQFQFQFFFLTPALALILTRTLTKRWLDIKEWLWKRFLHFFTLFSHQSKMQAMKRLFLCFNAIVFSSSLFSQFDYFSFLIKVAFCFFLGPTIVFF